MSDRSEWKRESHGGTIHLIWQSGGDDTLYVEVADESSTPPMLYWLTDDDMVSLRDFLIDLVGDRTPSVAESLLAQGPTTEHGVFTTGPLASGRLAERIDFGEST